MALKSKVYWCVLESHNWSNWSAFVGFTATPLFLAYSKISEVSFDLEVNNLKIWRFANFKTAKTGEAPYKNSLFGGGFELEWTCLMNCLMTQRRLKIIRKKKK